MIYIIKFNINPFIIMITRFKKLRNPRFITFKKHKCL